MCHHRSRAVRPFPGYEKDELLRLQQILVEGICRFWTPNAAAFRNLGAMYVGDERFKATYEKIAAGGRVLP
jgi:hypothetical protein